MGKGMRSLETGKADGTTKYEEDLIEPRLITPNPDRLGYIRYAFERGYTEQQVQQLTSIDPWFLAEMQQLVIEHRICVEDSQNILGGDGRFAVVQFDDDACHTLLAEWDEHASADDWHGVRGHAVGEDHVQRHGDGDVTEFGHRIQRG